MIGHKEIYEWEALTDSGKKINNSNCLFHDLPFDDVICVILKPKDDEYPTIRYPTCKERVTYFRRVITNLITKKQRVLYVIGKDSMYYVIIYPDNKFVTIKSLEELHDYEE